MLKSIATLFVCSLLSVSAGIQQNNNSIIDSHGNLKLMKAQEVGVQMVEQCKSFKIKKNPPLVPRLKCRFS